MTVVGPAEPPELELPDVQPVPIPDAPPMKPDVPPVLIPDAPPMKPEQSIANVEPAQPATPPIGGPQSIMPMPDKAPQTVVIDGRPMTVVDPAQKPKGLLDIDTRNQITNELELDRSPASNKARINPNNFDLRRFDAVKIPQRTGFWATVGAQMGYTYAPFVNYLSNAVRYGTETEVGYNSLQDMEGYEQYESSLIFAVNADHMAAMKAEIDANLERRRLLYNASFGTQFFAGMLDPINLIALPYAPVVGIGRSALRTGVSVAILQSGQNLSAHLLILWQLLKNLHLILVVRL